MSYSDYATKTGKLKQSQTMRVVYNDCFFYTTTSHIRNKSVMCSSDDSQLLLNALNLIESKQVFGIGGYIDGLPPNVQQFQMDIVNI